MLVSVVPAALDQMINGLGVQAETPEGWQRLGSLNPSVTETRVEKDLSGSLWASEQDFVVSSSSVKQEVGSLPTGMLRVRYPSR